MKKSLRNLMIYISALSSKNMPTIFMYHSIDDNDIFFTVSKNDFEKQIKILKKNSHNFIVECLTKVRVMKWGDR